jgi:hypothetical protein
MRQGKTVILLTIIFSLAVAVAESEGQQNNNLWKTLAKVTYKKEYDPFLGFDIEKPVFSEETKALDGKEVIVKGYVVPVEGYKSHKEFVLSAFPYNMCFFCGGAGPETVMEVYADEGVEFDSEAIYLKGTLKLNYDDINHLMYSLENAKKIDSPSGS